MLLNEFIPMVDSSRFPAGWRCWLVDGIRRPRRRRTHSIVRSSRASAALWTNHRDTPANAFDDATTTATMSAAGSLETMTVRIDCGTDDLFHELTPSSLGLGCQSGRFSRFRRCRPAKHRAGLRTIGRVGRRLSRG
jgi:hypothetical protein